MVRTFERIADLDLQIDSYELQGLEREVSSRFRRHTTVVRLRGGGEEGLGEDVAYDAEDQLSLRRAGAVLPLAGRDTLAGFSRRLGQLDLFPEPPVRDSSRSYRRWAFESAALDLALRQRGVGLADALGRSLRPLTFVVSLRLDEPASVGPIRRWLEIDDGLRFKLDPTSSWDAELIAELNATRAVDVVDFKGFYEGTIVDQPADAGLYERVASGLPAVWIEDPRLTPQTEPVLLEHRGRITWDAPIHGVGDIESLPFPPRTVNVKPSRFGSLEELLDTYDHCEASGIGMYGGGQFELGPGRGQIQHLASLFHADAPNDVAPTAYNAPEPTAGLPRSPLEPRAAPAGFRWDSD